MPQGVGQSSTDPVPGSRTSFQYTLECTLFRHSVRFYMSAIFSLKANWMLKFDLRWHFGQGFYLLAIARRMGRARGMDDQQIREMLRAMKSGGGYEGLLDAMERWLPDTFEFLGDPRQPASRPATPIDQGVPSELQDLLSPEVFLAEMNDMNVAGLLRF